MLTASLEAAPLVVIAVFMLLNVWHKGRKSVRSVHGRKIETKPCPWCGKKLSTGLTMLAHVDNVHNGGKAR